jgi:hypothetical protein
MLSIIFAECHKLFMLSVVTPKNLIIRHLHRGLISWSFSTLKAPSAWIKSYKTFFGQYMPWRLHWKSIIGSDSGWTLTSEAGATLVLNRPYSQTYGKAINCQMYLSGASGTKINISLNWCQVIKNSTFSLFVNGQHITTQRLDGGFYFKTFYRRNLLYVMSWTCA